MKKFLKLTTVVVSMVMALTFVSCSDGNSSNNGNENLNDGQLNLVGTYGLSKVEDIYKSSTQENVHTMTMLTSTSFRKYETLKMKFGEETIFTEMDYTITKTADGYSFDWAKYNINGKAASEEEKAKIVEGFNDDEWIDCTVMFAMTLITTEDGKWSMLDTSGTYTVDEKNSKVILTALIAEGETLDEPEIMEATYSDNGKTLVVVTDDSSAEKIDKSTTIYTRK